MSQLIGGERQLAGRSVLQLFEFMSQIVKDFIVRFERRDLLEDELLVNIRDQFIVTIVLGNHRMHLFKQENQSIDRDSGGGGVVRDGRERAEE